MVLGLMPVEPEAAPLPSPFSVRPDAPPVPTAPASDPETATVAANELAIPSLGVRAPMLEGSIVEGPQGRSLSIPGDPAALTLYEGGATPCDTAGTVLIAGHVSSHGVHGALWSLAQIAPRARVEIGCADGTRTTWEATAVMIVGKDELPQDIFTRQGDLRALIVTCGGPVMPDGHYRDNVLVELVRSWPPVEVGG